MTWVERLSMLLALGSPSKPWGAAQALYTVSSPATVAPRRETGVDRRLLHCSRALPHLERDIHRQRVHSFSSGLQPLPRSQHSRPSPIPGIRPHHHHNRPLTALFSRFSHTLIYCVPVVSTQNRVLDPPCQAAMAPVNLTVPPKGRRWRWR